MRLITWTQAVGLGISIATTIALLLTKQDSTISIVVGLLLASLTQLVEIQIRINESDEHVAQMISVGRRLPAHRDVRRQIQEVVEAYYFVLSTRTDLPKIFRSMAVSELGRFHEVARNIHLNRALLDSSEEPYHFSTVALNQAASIVRAVDTGDLEHWNTQEGRTYSRLNISRCKAEIRIIRIIIHSLEDIARASVLDVIEEQVAGGVEVFLADPLQIDRRLDQDYLIVDDLALAHSHLATDGRVVQRRISCLKAEIDERIHQFERLKAKSTRLELSALRMLRGSYGAGSVVESLG